MIMHDQVEEADTIQDLVCSESINEKAHPWRRCAKGKHFVREHIVHVSPSKKHPEGVLSTWHEHCVSNPSHKEELSCAEILYITDSYFSALLGPPTANILIEFQDADTYDQEIRGWVRYWNAIFHLNDPLEPDLVKALIATESSFDPNPTRVKNAHGLMQITNLTFRILHDTQGELKDYLIRVTQKELLKPSVNICSGVRWLFRKKETASARLDRIATWDEAIIEYKGYWDEVNTGKDPKPMQHLREYFKRLVKG